MNKFWKTALPLVVAIVFVSLLIVFWEVWFDNFILPIAILFWQGWRILTSVDQTIYWGMLIFVCLLIVYRLIPVRKKALPKAAYQGAPKPPNRVDYWAALFAEASLGKNEREYLRSNLQELYLSLITQLRRAEKSEAQEVLEGEKDTLSVAARQYLFPEEDQSENSDLSAFRPHWTRRMKTKNSHPNGSGIEEILDWMENDLEINNDS